MKQISLIAILVIAVIISSCGKKEEKKEALSDKNEIVDESKPDTSINYTSYEEFVSDGSDINVTNTDTTKKSDMIFIEPTNEIQIDPPVDTKKEPVKEIKKETKKEVKKEPKKEVIKAEKSHELKFYVVVGSFKNYSNAENLNAYFKTKGYSPMILPKANGYNRVAISSYAKETDARTAIKKLRTEHNDLTFWLYKW